MTAGLHASAGETKTGTLDRSDAKNLKNPIPFTRASLAQGRNLYLRTTCQECHDMDGRALKASDMAEAADLTDPRSWLWGKTDGHIFLAIREGTEGQMPGFKEKLNDDQIWHLVNYIRSIGPKALKPPIVKAEPEEEIAAEEPAPLDPEKLKNPLPFTRASIAQGRNFYLRTTCQECHDLDGRALSGSDMAEAADLTDPRSWLWGATDGHIFVAIRQGTKGQMPGFKEKLKDDQIWHLVNYIRSIGPKKLKPTIAKDQP
jgi:mono/diheme cytochrome c family protein